MRAPGMVAFMLAAIATVWLGIVSEQFVVAMLVPPAAALAAALYPSRRAYAIAAAATALIVLLGALSVGLFYVPALVVLLAGIARPRPGPRRD